MSIAIRFRPAKSIPRKLGGFALNWGIQTKWAGRVALKLTKFQIRN